MADDVTDPAPLRGGRQRANHIQVHRLELGLTERRMAQEAFIVAATPVLIVSGAVGLAAFGVYRISCKFASIPEKTLEALKPGTEDTRGATWAILKNWRLLFS